MILYHGSYVRIEKPEISHSRDNVDFGKGFYTTPIREQAVKWAERFKRRKGTSILSVFEYHETDAKQNARIKDFNEYSEEWLDYIVSCRKGERNAVYDIVIGGVADDKVFDTIELYLEGLIEKTTAIQRLKYEKPNLQLCFCSQEAIVRYLQYIDCEVLN